MFSLEQFCNWFVYMLIKFTERYNLGYNVLCPGAVFIELFYAFFSKFNITNRPKARLNRYISKYTKLNPIDQKSEKKIAIVTGANNGIGFATSKALMLAGFHVIFACRSKKLANKAMTKIQNATSLKNCEYMHLDLSSFQSINQFTTKFKSKHSSLKLLFNNAGVLMCPFLKTKDGIELQFGTNYVGHFLLTNNLLDVLKQSAPARIINVSSLLHIVADANIKKIKERTMDPIKYHRARNYGNSKLAIIMFSNLLARKLAGTGVVVNSVHPGVVNTRLQRHQEISNTSLLRFINYILLLTPTAGALTGIKIAISPEFKNVTGKYFSWENKTGPLPFSRDMRACQQLWRFTESLIKNHSK
ncbi:hypothetical protein BB560_000961 [Smittium megazygosporum]|uniref:Uncharacterized protein n=1 Tax=Smittium megazygosporum TaxID=133381 RepID=A0A2T9ZJ47_9FUNG|nr:hypothetical protein BB560_000961 [Smittium megazygosporum]